jgi:cell wall-associated NlpC family hydrolase
VVTAAFAAWVACERPRAAGRDAGGGARAAPAGGGACPARAPAPAPLPGITPEQETLGYWLGRVPDPDAVVLSPAAIHDLNARLRSHEVADPPPELLRPVGASELLRRVNARLGALRRHAERGEFVDEQGRRLDDAALAALAPVASLPEATPALRVALAPIPIRCTPLARGFYKTPVDLAFDRNLCATAAPQEPLELLATFPDGSRLVRTRYVVGWIAAGAPLSPPVEPGLRRRLLAGPHVRARAELALASPDGGTATLPAGTLLAAAGRGAVHFATAAGWHVSAPVAADRLVPTTRPLTRRALLEEAFAALGRPYQWGGRDCSGFLLDLFAGFGLELPRNSSEQARAGAFTIDVGADVSERERLALIDAAAQGGIVLLHFPGHIMLYLGRAAAGQPMILHAFAEYLVPCPGGGETIVSPNRVAVTTLELGRGSSRRSFIERLTRIVVLAERLPPGLEGVAAPREAAPVTPPAACREARGVSLWISPEAPNARQPLRAIVVSARGLDPVGLTFFDPAGRAVRPELHRLGGPPFGYWAAVDEPAAGRWTIVAGDGARVEACRRVRVGPTGRRPVPRDGPVWGVRRAWTPHVQALYALFVEQLFDYPLSEDRTWTGLQELIDNPEKNLLHGHLGLGEDAALGLKPDCADLPYYLRAYFAWKLGLPYAVRQCNRGGAGRPPTCRAPELSNLKPRETPVDDVAAFTAFTTREVRSAVHSGNGRTAPKDEETDYYPVPLTRAALRPGTIFADPYGHVLVVAKWRPQTPGRPGVLVGADAQPDGTVGRRRFWRGTFLFRPETTEAGAGFKDFRPLRYHRADDTITPVGNDELRRTREFLPFSDEQNRGSVDDFYDRVERLASPRPVDPEARLLELIDALAESAQRRVTSIANGEEYTRTHPAPMSMPVGYAIFETKGAWEDFATPSRDMRLLIAIDTVAGFPAEVRRRPANYGLAAGAALEETVARLAQRLADELRRRSFVYTRSDGAQQTLTLADLVARAPALEVAYNPNDCIERRWAAPEGSPELAACRRQAPEEQRARMAQYRSWFHTRTRPVR